MNKHNENGVNEAAQDTRAYATFPHAFHDPWAEAEVELKFRFAKPGKTQIKRLTDTAAKNATQAARDLLLGVIHPDDREKLLLALEDYPGIATSYSTALIKAVGISADLGN